MPFKFKKLKVWKCAIDLSEDDQLTREFPNNELYILTSQFKRAADSISLNIAEGSTGQSNAEQRKFISYAIRSLCEYVNCLYLSIRRNYISFAMLIKFRNGIV